MPVVSIGCLGDAHLEAPGANHHNIDIRYEEPHVNNSLFPAHAAKIKRGSSAPCAARVMRLQRDSRQDILEFLPSRDYITIDTTEVELRQHKLREFLTIGGGPGDEWLGSV